MKPRQHSFRDSKAASRSNVHHGALYALFFLSGISGLVYETVWLRILIRVLGNTSHATAVVLAAFMAGMAIGSYLIGRYASGVKNQLRFYAVLEFGVGVTAVGLTLLLLRLTPFYQTVYLVLQGSRFGLTIFQAIMMFLLMLLPTCLMGGTLPVLSAYTKTFSLAFTPRIGILYGINTLGAVLGVLGSGFFTIGQWGEMATLLTGAGISVTVAILALALSAREPDGSSARVAATRADWKKAAISPYPASLRRLVGFAYAISGFVAMSYEIIWTRTFQIHVGTSIYAFSIMLAFYLAGIGVGSLVGGRLLANVKCPIWAFGIAQLGIALYSILGLYLGTLFSPVSLVVDLRFSNGLIMPLLVVFPITAVLGALFPVVCRCYVANEAEVGRAVGRLYCLNTLGCIAGSLVCGFIFIWLFGTRGTILLLAVLNATIGLLMLFLEPGTRRRARMAWASVGYIVVMAMLALWGPDPFKVAVRHAVETLGLDPDAVTIYYHNENVTATTTALGLDDNPLTKQLWVNGIGMTNLCLDTKLMAHLPLLLHRCPKNVLVICFGMGSTVRAVWAHKTVEADVVELVPEVFECFRYFHPDGPAILADPRIHCYADDGRNFLLLRPKKYDVITIDPAPPIWSAGTVNLYTKEFLELCKARLEDHGLVCLWIPPTASSEMRMIMKTFATVFPNTQVWRSPARPVLRLYMVGFANPEDPARSGLRQPEDEQPILADLNEIRELLGGQRISSLAFLKFLFLMTPDALAKFVADQPVITDDRPYTEFPLWRSFLDPAYRKRMVLSSAKLATYPSLAPQ